VEDKNITLKESVREAAMSWWNEMPLEEKFYKCIKQNQLIMGDKTRHPNTLTGYEIESIFLNEVPKPLKTSKSSKK
jgi:hypothetical protein